MAWKIEFTSRAAKDFKKLDRKSQKEVEGYFVSKVLKCKNPMSLGKPLRFPLSGLWRYRIGKIRAICKIEKNRLVVVVLKVASRDVIYQ